MKKYKRLYVKLRQETLRSAMVRFHYEDQPDLFAQVYKRLSRCIQPMLYYEYDQPDKNRMTGLITLGSGPDNLIAAYQDKGQLSKAYAAECLSLELLSDCYRQLKEIVFRERRQFLENMDFCDQQMLARLFPKLKKEWPDLPVSMNSCYALIPSQSVIFYGTIGDSACFGETHMCHLCDHANCTFRHATGENYEY